MTEEIYKECNYRFKGNSCKECPLGCIGKIDELTRLKQENKNAKTTVEECHKYMAKLEDENEELKKEVKQIGSDFIKKGDYARELEQENKELKKDVQLFKCLDTFGESECHCACRCLGNEFCEDADKKINSYRSALEEIRVFCKNQNDDWCNDIVNKINEVLGC